MIQEEFVTPLFTQDHKEARRLIIEAHSACSANRPALQRSKSCGCFYCLSIYNPHEITE